MLFKSTAVVVTVVTTVTVCHYVGHLLSSNKIMSMDDSVSTESHDHTELSRTSQKKSQRAGLLRPTAPNLGFMAFSPPLLMMTSRGTAESLFPRTHQRY